MLQKHEIKLKFSAWNFGYGPKTPDVKRICQMEVKMQVVDL